MLHLNKACTKQKANNLPLGEGELKPPQPSPELPLNMDIFLIWGAFVEITEDVNPKARGVVL